MLSLFMYIHKIKCIYDALPVERYKRCCEFHSVYVNVMGRYNKTFMDLLVLKLQNLFPKWWHCYPCRHGHGGYIHQMIRKLPLAGALVNISSI